jgi:hypothetical protein
MKTNKEKNLEYDAKAQARVRPAIKEYNWKPLEDVIKAWKERANEQT